MRFEQMTRATSARPESNSHESPGGDGRLASASQRRCAHAGFAGAGRRQARRRRRIPVAGRFLDVSGADLSRAPPRAAGQEEDRRTHRDGKTGRHPYRDGRPDRPCRAGLLHQGRSALHDELHDAVSGIHFGALADPRAMDLQRAAAFPCGGDRDDGGHAVADDRAWRTRLRPPRHVDARRGRRSVPAGSRHRSRLSRGRSS